MIPPRPLLSLSAVVFLIALAGCAPAPAFSADVPLMSSADLGPADGYIATGDSVRLTDDVPAVTELASDLRDALALANAAAESDRGVEITLTSGWRSARYQQSLFDEAAINYGSEAEAGKWVKRPDGSKHVTGEAVDVATADAMDWLNRFGSQYGLCQVYANEAWHFELVADASGVCPAMLSDSTVG